MSPCSRRRHVIVARLSSKNACIRLVAVRRLHFAADHENGRLAELFRTMPRYPARPFAGGSDWPNLESPDIEPQNLCPANPAQVPIPEATDHENLVADE